MLLWTSNKYYIFWVCVCSLRYPARNAHAPYCHLWPVWLYNILPHYLINGTISEEEKNMDTEYVLIFSTNFSATLLILRATEQDMVKKFYWFSCKVPVMLFRFWWKLKFSRQMFGKNTQISNFMKICPLGAALFHADGQTDRQDEANSGSSQRCERA